MKRITTYKGRNSVEEEITREELDMFVYFGLAKFSGSEYDPIKKCWVDRWRWS